MSCRIPVFLSFYRFSLRPPRKKFGNSSNIICPERAGISGDRSRNPPRKNQQSCVRVDRPLRRTMPKQSRRPKIRSLRDFHLPLSRGLLDPPAQNVFARPTASGFGVKRVCAQRFSEIMTASTTAANKPARMPTLAGPSLLLNAIIETTAIWQSQLRPERHILAISY